MTDSHTGDKGKHDQNDHDRFPAGEEKHPGMINRQRAGASVRHPGMKAFSTIPGSRPSSIPSPTALFDGVEESADRPLVHGSFWRFEIFVIETAPPLQTCRLIPVQVIGDRTITRTEGSGLGP